MRTEKYLKLILCDPRNQSKEIILKFRVFETAIAQKWADLVSYLDSRNSVIKTPERFYNFDGDIKAGHNWILHEIQDCVSGINRYHPDFIDNEMIAGRREITQQWMNQLHEYFVNGALALEVQAVFDLQNINKEISSLKHLILDKIKWQQFSQEFYEYTGETPDNRTILEIVSRLEGHPRYAQVLDQLTYAFGPAQPFLERLNQAIHRWEDRCAIEQQIRAGGDIWRYFVMVYSPACGIPLEDDDYQYYTIRDVFGRVYLDDILPGKCLWDIYRDQDDYVTGEHYKNLTHFWGDARFYFGPTHSEENNENRLQDFWQWFEENEHLLQKMGFHRGDPHLTIGRLPVADLVVEGELSQLGEQQIVRLIGEHQYIKRAVIVDAADNIMTTQWLADKKWVDIIGNNLQQTGRMYF